MLELRRALAHGLGGGRPSGTRHQRSVHARPPDVGLGSLVGRVYESEPSLHPRQGEHAVLLQGGREFFRCQAVYLVASVGYEVEHESQLSYLPGEFLHLLVAHSRRVPVKGRREVVGEHLVRINLVNSLGESPRVLEVRGLRLHPEHVREGRGGERLGYGVFDSALDLVVSLGSSRKLGVPGVVDSERVGRLHGLARRGGSGELPPLRGRHGELGSLLDVEVDELLYRFAERAESRFLLPRLDESRDYGVEGGLEPVGVRSHLFYVFVYEGRHAGLLEPPGRARAGAVAHVVELVSVYLLHALLVDSSENREVAVLVARNVEFRRSEDERLVALVSVSVEKRGRLGVGSRNDDSRHFHYVELEPRGVQPLYLLVAGHENLSSLVAALLGPGLLVLYVVSRHARFHEPADQVPHVGVASVARVRVGHYEGAVVDLGSFRPFLLRHSRAVVSLVLVRGQKRPHYRGRLVRHLAQGIAGEVRALVFRYRPLGRSRPSAQVDGLYALSLHHDGLAGRVGTEGRYLLFAGEKLPKPRVEGRGRVLRDRVVVSYRPPLLDHLAGGVQAGGVPETRAREIPLGFPYLGFKKAHDFVLPGFWFFFRNRPRNRDSR